MIAVVVFVAGFAVLAVVWTSALRTLVPRETPPRATRWAVHAAAAVVTPLARRMSLRPREQAMTMVAPIGLFVLLAVWLVGHGLAFGLMAISIDGLPLSELGAFFALQTNGADLAIGLICVVSTFVLIGTFVVYLVVVLNAYGRRELFAVWLSARAASPPDAERILAGYVRYDSHDRLDSLFGDWTGWLADIRCSHVNYPALVYLRPASSLCWLQAAVIMLDTAALLEAIAPSRETPFTKPLLDTGIRCLERLSTDLEVARSSTAVSLQGREQFGFDDTTRVTSAAGLIAERSPQDAWRSFQSRRTRYAPLSTAIASLLLHNMVDSRSDAVSESTADADQ
ncbi:MAG TPA: hypothetical protein VGL80_32370 [Pseudonocardiaceae bacterium]